MSYSSDLSLAPKARKKGSVEVALSLTEKVKQELAQVTLPRQSARAAEASAMLRFAGALLVNGDHMSYEVEFDDEVTAKRLAEFLDDLARIRAAAARD